MKSRIAKLTGLPLLCLLMSGCATVMLPAGPDIYSLSMRPNAATVVVANPTDSRVNKDRLGSIGATQYSMKADPRDLVGKEIVFALHEQGLNGLVSRELGDSSSAIAQAVSSANADAAIEVNIEDISVKSIDILLDPPTARIQLRATLYDGQGNRVESATVVGQVQRRISMFGYEKEAGELVAEAMHDAAKKLFTNIGLEKALKKVVSEK